MICKLVVGGVGKSASEVVAEAVALEALVVDLQRGYGFLASVDTDPLKSKTVVLARLRDEYGEPINLGLDLMTLAQEGLVSIPLLPESESHSDLGIQLHADHRGTTIATFAQDLETFKARAEIHLDRDLPATAQMYSLWVSILGGTQWLADKGGCIPVQLADEITMMTISLVKQICRLPQNASSNLVFLPKIKYGVGFPHFKFAIMKRSLLRVILDKTSDSPDVKSWSWYEAEYARVANGIKQASCMHAGGFFMWSMTDLTVKNVLEMPFQCQHTWAAACCLQWNIRLFSAVEPPSSTIHSAAALVPKLTLLEEQPNSHGHLDPSGMITGKRAIGATLTRVQSDWFTMHCQSLHSASIFQASEQMNDKLSNAWRSDQSLTAATYAWSVSATQEQTVTPAVRCTRWKKIPSAACPMAGCTWKYCNLQHIEQHCMYSKKRVQVRHNKVFDPITQFIIKHCGHWPYVGEPDCSPPEYLTPIDWRHRVAMLTTGGEAPATKPDFIIADVLAPAAAKVRIMDVQVTWDTLIWEAEGRKINKYQPLVRVMKAHWQQKWGYDLDVRVVPLVFGTRSTVSTDWHNHMAAIGANMQKTDQVAKDISLLIIRESASIYFQWCAHERTIPGRR